MMNWHIYTAISVVALAVSVLLQRVLLSKDKTDATAYVIVFQGLAGILTLVAAMIHGLHMPDLSGLWLPAIGCVLLYAIGHILYAKTLQRVEASVFGVLFATHTIWITALGVLLFRERLTPLTIAGIGLMLASLYVLVHQSKHFKLDRGIVLGLLTGVCFGAAITAWSYVGREVSDPLTWTAVSFIAPALLVWLARPAATRHLQPMLQPGRLLRMGALATFYSIGCMAMIFAYKYGEFSVVSPLRQSGVVLVVLLALLFLPAERTHIGRKLAATVLCVAGVLCLV